MTKVLASSKKKILLGVFILVIIGGSFVFGYNIYQWVINKADDNGENDPNYTNDDYPFEAALEDRLNLYLQTEEVKGISLGIVKNQSLVFAKGYGFSNLRDEIPMTNSTVFPIASISKTVTAVAIMQLYEQGLFKLTDNISEYLSYNIYNPYYPNDSITFEMLLTHTSSLAHDIDTQETFTFCSELEEDYSLEQFIYESLVEGQYYFGYSNFINFRPGSGYSYSNTGFALLGLLVEEISGMEYAEYCRNNIFQPLGMNYTSWFTSEANQANLTRLYDSQSGFQSCMYNMKAYPAGNLRTNILDLSKFLAAIMNLGTLHSIQILNSTTVSLMRDIHFFAGDISFGLGWYHTEIYGDEVIGHNGMIIPGVSTLMFFNPLTDVGAIYFVNTDSAHHYDVFSRLLKIGEDFF